MSRDLLATAVYNARGALLDEPFAKGSVVAVDRAQPVALQIETNLSRLCVAHSNSLRGEKNTPSGLISRRGSELRFGRVATVRDAARRTVPFAPVRADLARDAHHARFVLCNKGRFVQSHAIKDALDTSTDEAHLTSLFRTLSPSSSTKPDGSSLTHSLKNRPEFENRRALAKERPRSPRPWAGLAPKARLATCRTPGKIHIYIRSTWQNGCDTRRLAF